MHFVNLNEAINESFVWKQHYNLWCSFFANIDIGELLTPIHRCSRRFRCCGCSMSDVHIDPTLIIIMIMCKLCLVVCICLLFKLSSKLKLKEYGQFRPDQCVYEVIWCWENENVWLLHWCKFYLDTDSVYADLVVCAHNLVRHDGCVVLCAKT